MRPECQQCQECMEAAFGAELEAGHRSALEAHLAGCEDCRANWEEDRLIRRSMDWFKTREEGPSPFVEAKILRAAAARNAEKAALSPFWRWLLRPSTIGFATLFLIVGIGYLGREELFRHRQPENLTAPTAAPPPAAPAPPAAEPQRPKDKAPPPQPDASGVLGGSTGSARQADKPISPPAPAQGLRQEAKPPAPAEKAAPKPDESKPLREKARVQPAPTLPASPSDAIPEAEVAAPPALQPAPLQDAEKKKSDAAPAAGAAPAKSLQRAAPQPGASATAPADEGAAKEPNEKPGPEEIRLDKLLRGAKAKIHREDFAGALEDLLTAQKIRDTKEIQDLILLCRSHLRGDG